MIIYPNFLIRLWCLTNFLIQHKITFMNLRIFFHFAHLKPTFVYFTHSFLQNTHISLSILHIYSIKYSFFYIFYYFLTHGLSLSLSLKPNHHQGRRYSIFRGLKWTPWIPKKKKKNYIYIYIYIIFFLLV